ncbi:MAG: DUF2911 domain-containing protein [Bacteroidota bacterium]
MKKIIVISGIGIAFVAAGIIGFRFYTKSFSPQGVSEFEEADRKLRITYSRPFKRERKIFGELVPYNKVWRTGANEATSFETNIDLKIEGKLLPAGTYSIFTVPGEESWQVIFNKEVGQWGIDVFSGEANRDDSMDVLTIEVQPIQTQHVFEQFTIDFEHVAHEIEMVLIWDQTLVVVPIKPA